MLCYSLYFYISEYFYQYKIFLGINFRNLILIVFFLFQLSDTEGEDRNERIHSLSIKHTLSTDSGEVTLVASNSQGSVKATTALRVSISFFPLSLTPYFGILQNKNLSIFTRSLFIFMYTYN